jgi:putative hemolysin
MNRIPDRHGLGQCMPTAGTFSSLSLGQARELEREPRLSPLRVQGAYRLRFAETPRERQAAYRLRFLVFNLELNEGLASAFRDGYDCDEFDQVCDHLIVEHVPSGEVIGTYRLQTGDLAARNIGYYSAQEFDFSPYEHLRSAIVELGRAAIHRDHRSFDVLTLLWRGIADYARQRSARYLVGCSSLSSQSLREGSSLYWSLQNFLAEPRLRTRPLPGSAFILLPPNAETQKPRPPKLLRAYLSIGARICGEPALDREFGTIDFLTLLDLDQLAHAARSRFLR